MNILRWILIAGIPFLILLNVIRTIMIFQHWPIGRDVAVITAALFYLIMIIAWVFALKSRKNPGRIAFDSIPAD